MDSWEQVILEWVNCLGILKNPMKDIQDLCTVNFYKELIKKLPQEDGRDELTEDNIILSFITAEYPEFEVNFPEKHDKLEGLQIASLLLLHTAHEPTFHRPMCLKLQHETQIKIKSFLEMLLPYEKNVTKEILLEAITALEEASPKNFSTTPKTKPLKEFFSSPAARSAHSHRIMSERVREIRQLKSELETERFEKMDLQEDLLIQQAKIGKLEKALEERTAELKALRAEQMRCKTPQSSKKCRNGQHPEDFYKREIKQLENELLRFKSQAERYAEERNDLMKKMSAIEKQCTDVREKYKLSEKSLEIATVQLELKDRELADLHANNEELRTHLREITRAPVEEPSFEGESLLRPRSPVPVASNISESLSSVIDIQFQEAKEESASLRLELNSLGDKLQAVTAEYQKVLRENEILRERTGILEVDIAEAEHCKNILHKQIEALNDTVDKLEKSLLVEVDERLQLKTLTQTVETLEKEKQSFSEYVQSLSRDTEYLKEDFAQIMLSRETVETALTLLKEKWSAALDKFKSIFIADSSLCDELKHLQAKKEELDKALRDYEIVHLENTRPLAKTLWQTFLWAEGKLASVRMRLERMPEGNEANAKHECESDFSEEKKVIEMVLKNNQTTYEKIRECEKGVETFVSLASSYESSVNAGQVKKEPRAEEKLKLQIDQLTKERKDLKVKLDNMRVRNAKLEKNMDDLRAELKRIKAENSSNELSALEVANEKVKQLEGHISRLQKENEELSKRPKEEELDKRLREVHSKYELTLENMKEKMKSAYNEQVGKMNKQQERIVQGKMDEMRQLCQKHAEEIKRYKEHVGQLSKQLWSVGENLLIAQKEKEETAQQLREFKAKLHNTKRDSDEQKVASTHNRNRAAGNDDSLPDYSSSARPSAGRSAESTHEERMFERRSSMRSMQAMGNAFNAEDEEGEVFDSRYLADMKEGKCLPSTHLDRLSVLQMRNSLCKPHLKSSYPAETQFHPLGFTEEDIKNLKGSKRRKENDDNT